MKAFLEAPNSGKEISFDIQSIEINDKEYTIYLVVFFNDANKN